jgi:hypothetical protein
MWTPPVHHIYFGEKSVIKILNKYFGEKNVIKIFNTYFVCYLYIMDFINLWNMEHIKIEICKLDWCFMFLAKKF